MSLNPKILGVGVFAALVLRADAALWSYWLRTPGAFWGGSLWALMREAAWPALAVSAIVLLSWGLGRAVWKMLDFPETPEAHSAAFALGAGLWATALWTLGWAGGLRPWPMALLAGAVFTSAFPALRRLRPRPVFDFGSSIPRALAGALIAYALFHAAVVALAPPVDADALAYHLTLPKLYLAQGSTEGISWLPFSRWPHLASVLSALALALGLVNGPALLSWAAAAFLLAAVYRVARAELGEPEAVLACAVLIVQPVIADFAGTPRVESWWALFNFLAVTAAWRWHSSGKRRALLLAGIFAGLGAAVKLMGVIVLLSLAAWSFLRQGGGFRRRAGAAALFLGAGFAVVGPWYLKCWIETGNPVWPFFPELLGDRFGAVYMLPRFLARNHWPADVDLAFLLQRGAAHLAAPTLLLAAARACRLFPAWPGFLAFQALLFAQYAALAGWSYEFWRYCAPWMPAMAMLAAWGAVYLWRSGGLSRVLGSCLIIFSLAPVLGLRHGNELFAVLGLRSTIFPGRPAREVFLERSVPFAAAFGAVNAWYERAGRPKVKILLLTENCSFYLDAPYQWGHWFFQGLLPYEELSGAASLDARLKAMQISHILASPGWEKNFSARAAAILGAELALGGVPVLEKDGYRLLALPSLAAAQQAVVGND